MNKQFGMPPAAARVFYDGLCRVCSAEIEFYRKKDPAAPIQWVDITQTGFDAVAEGLNPDEVHRLFHVKTQDGKILQGVEAFRSIWSAIPALHGWAKWSSLPGVRPLMELGYRGFVWIRPWLPRRSAADCGEDACRLPPSARAKINPEGKREEG